MPTIDIELSVKEAFDDAIARIVAIGGLVALALIHMIQLPDAFHEIGYLGALFIAAIVASLGLAAILTRTSDEVVWAAAGSLAALVLLGYVISRSVGLPGFTDDMGEWAERPGLVSMVVEGLLVLVSTAVLATRRAPAPSAERTPAGYRGASMPLSN
jgi:hypothetical protein